jgi:tetratricopeptide (TPR) repeat protein
MSYPSKKNMGFIVLLFVIIAGVGYSNSFNGPFIFDDQNIVDNPSIRSLWPLLETFHPPKGTGIAGRPVINFTLALNYAVSGEHVWSYHALNLLIHMLSALTLFGIIRRTLLWEGLSEKYSHVSTELAMVCGLIWMIHPLQTQSVTYIIQRCESLMGLCFLLIFYCAIRGWQSDRSGHWHLLAVLVFIVGAGTKEIIIVAPFLLFVYDMMFVHNSPRKALQSSQKLYMGLLFGLLFLGLLIMKGGTQSALRGDTPYTPLQYALTQAQVICHYLRLSIWPDSLCIDYRWPIAAGKETIPYVFIILALLGAAAGLLYKRHPSGFLFAWFFIILAPTSSIIPIPDIAFEHRMYLPLASVVIICVFGGYEGGRYLFTHFSFFYKHVQKDVMIRVSFALVSIIVLILGLLTYLRNMDYRSEIAIWTDTVKKRPLNQRAHFSLGSIFLKAEKPEEALIHFNNGFVINPNNPDAHTNLGIVLSKLGRYQEAVEHFKKAVELMPTYAYVYNDAGRIWMDMNKPHESIPYFEKSLQIKPDDAEIQALMGLALIRSGSLPESIPYFQKALQLNDPDQDRAGVYANLGLVFFSIGQTDTAVFYLQKSITIAPENAGVQSLLGAALASSGKLEEALVHFQESLRLNPDNAEVHNNIGLAFFDSGRLKEAAFHFNKSLSIHPDNQMALEYLKKLE